MTATVYKKTEFITYCNESLVELGYSVKFREKKKRKRNVKPSRVEGDLRKKEKQKIGEKSDSEKQPDSEFVID